MMIDIDDLVRRMRAVDELFEAIRELYPEHIWSRGEILTLCAMVGSEYAQAHARTTKEIADDVDRELARRARERRGP